MPAPDLRFRQVHLDFHTSDAIAGIGDAFDPDAFAETLVRAHVDSITCFARCHHGWIYYDTERFAERRHPHLSRNLLAEQIEACHARDIRVPIYITVQWDDVTAQRHPEWRVVDADGRMQGTPPFEAGFYRRLCVNSPYREWLISMTKEVLDTLPVDGLFFDICAPVPCVCRHCRERMAAKNMDPSNAAARDRFADETMAGFMRAMSTVVREAVPDASIFYNRGHVGPMHRPLKDAYSHFELESLPSGGWGYMHFPLSMRYARNLGLDCLAMTAKFHTTWGDFHSFKNKEALEFECFRALALGAQCSIGDQLAPDGAIDPHVYDLIGGVYEQVEAKEPWCRGARPVTEIGVFTPEAFNLEGREDRSNPALIGATRMLQEAGHLFDVIDDASELSAYTVLVLPDHIPVDGALAERLAVFLKEGGALIASFESALLPGLDRFALDLGVKPTRAEPVDDDGRPVRGRPETGRTHTNYLLPGPEIGRGLPPTEHAMYMNGVEIVAEDGQDDAEILAETVRSHFPRTWRHYCSHGQTPSSGEVTGPAVVQCGRTIYFSHPIFSQYEQNAPRWCKTLLLNALDRLLPEPRLRHDGPSTLLIDLLEQPAENRQVLHLLHYVPERRSREIDIIEDVIPLHDLDISVRVDRPVASARCVPSGDALPLVREADRVSFTLRVLNGHQMIELNFG